MKPCKSYERNSFVEIYAEKVRKKQLLLSEVSTIDAVGCKLFDIFLSHVPIFYARFIECTK